MKKEEREEERKRSYLILYFKIEKFSKTSLSYYLTNQTIIISFRNQNFLGTTNSFLINLCYKLEKVEAKKRNYFIAAYNMFPYTTFAHILGRRKKVLT